MGRLPKNPKMTLAIIQGEAQDLCAGAVEVLREIGRKFQFSILFRPCYYEPGREEEALFTMSSCDAAIYGRLERHPYPYKSHPLCALANGIQSSIAMRHIFTFPSLCGQSLLKREAFLPRVDFMLISQRCTNVVFYDDRVSLISNTEKTHEVLDFAFSMAKKRKRRLINIIDDKEGDSLWRQDFTRLAVQNPNVLCEQIKCHEILSYASQIDVMSCDFHKAEQALNFARVLSVSDGMMPVAYMAEGFGGIYTCQQTIEPYGMPSRQINPVGMLLSISMMLEYTFNMPNQAAWLRRAVALVIEEGKRTIDMMEEGCTLLDTEEFIEAVCEKIRMPIRKRK